MIQYRLLPVILTAILCAVPSLAQPPLRVQGGNLVMSITDGVVDGDLIPIINTAANLRWRRLPELTKITVSTTCPGQRFTLQVFAVNPSEGVAAPEVTLTTGAPAVDLVTNMPAGGPKNNDCVLRYTASATFSQGNSAELGNDVHTVRYTIVAQ